MTGDRIRVVHTTVFRDGPDGGAPCPVVVDAEDMSDEGMRAAASFWGLESAFIRHPEQSDADLAVRFFAPNREMDMCVHGTVASVFVGRRIGMFGSGTVRVETPMGILAARVTRQDPAAEFEVPQFPPVFRSPQVTPYAAAKALGLPADAISRDPGPIQAVSTSRDKLIVPLQSLEDVRDVCPDYELLWHLCERHSVTGLYAFDASAPDVGRVEARHFPCRAGYLEDAATGVAACALGAYLTRWLGKLTSDAVHTFDIRQGISLGRPSLMRVRIATMGGSIQHVVVAGGASWIGEGALGQRSPRVDEQRASA